MSGYKISRWNVYELTGYEPQTTFWQDFSLADPFGLSAIKDTYNRAFRDWKDNYIYLTELVLVLNWKILAWYDQPDSNGRMELYYDLWAKADSYAREHLKGEELRYFYTTTD